MPRKYKAQPPAPKKGQVKLIAQGLVGQDPKTILLRYLSKESTDSIAASYGVTRQALGKFLLQHAEEEWKEAQVARAIARKEEADDEIEAAIRIYLTDTHNVPEGAAASALAAILRERPTGRVGVVFTGGNIDLPPLLRALGAAESKPPLQS